MKSRTNKEIKEMLIDLLQMKKDNTKEEKFLIKQVTESIRMKSLYFDLNKEFKQHIELNKMYKVYLNQARELKEDIKVSKNEVQVKCKALKEECRTLVIQMEKYDKIILDIKIDRETNYRLSNERLIALRKENVILNEKLEELTVQTKEQEKYLRETERSIKEYSTKLANDEENFKAYEKDFKKEVHHFNEEIKKYKEFLYMRDMEAWERTRASSMSRSQSMIIQEELDIKLKDNQLMNDYLHSKLHKMSSKVIQIKADVAKMKAKERYNTPSIKKKMLERINEEHWNQHNNNHNNNNKHNDNHTDRTKHQEKSLSRIMNDTTKIKHRYSSVPPRMSADNSRLDFYSY